MSYSNRPRPHRYRHQYTDCEPYPPIVVPVPVPTPTPVPIPVPIPIPVPTPIPVLNPDLNCIPIINLDDLPPSSEVPNGTMFLTGTSLNCSDSPPDLKDYYLVVSNGCYYVGFAPTMMAT